MVLGLLLIFCSYWLLLLTWSDANQSLFRMAEGFCGCKYIWPVVTSSEKSFVSLTCLSIVTIIVTSCHFKWTCTYLHLLASSHKLAISHVYLIKQVPLQHVYFSKILRTVYKIYKIPHFIQLGSLCPVVSNSFWGS